MWAAWIIPVYVSVPSLVLCLSFFYGRLHPKLLGLTSSSGLLIWTESRAMWAAWIIPVYCSVPSLVLCLSFFHGRLRVEGPGGEPLWRVLRLELQRRLQVDRADGGGPPALPGGRRRRLACRLLTHPPSFGRLLSLENGSFMPGGRSQVQARRAPSAPVTVGNEIRFWLLFSTVDSLRNKKDKVICSLLPLNSPNYRHSPHFIIIII